MPKLKENPEPKEEENLSEREWLKPKEVERLFSFSVPYIYQLISTNDIRSSLIKKKHGVRGIRLVETESVRSFIRSNIQTNPEVIVNDN